MIKLFDRKTISSINKSDFSTLPDWVEFLILLLQNGPSHYVENFNCDFLLLQINDKLIPIAQNNAAANNSHLTSINTYYISFGIDSIKHKLKSKLSGLVVSSFASMMQTIFSFSKLDRTIFINCWLMPTGPLVTLEKGEYDEVVVFLRNHFPDHALVFRGFTNFFKISGEQIAPDVLLLSRVYYQIENIKEILKTKNIKNALRTLKNTKYKIDDRNGIVKNDHQRMIALYNKLYIDKFSDYSLKYNEEWIELISKFPVFNIHLVRDEQELIQSFIVTLSDPDIIVSSIGAYNQGAVDSFNLYVLNFANRVVDANLRDKKINLSSGGDYFKRKRGGIPNVEYDIVYFKHLKGFTSLRWKVFSWLFKNVAERIYKNALN
ncbi:hypothetical protein [Pedobacter sp. KACC 23697]|uniref:GNAT family N-acetyltransferase n=1 Tax=Pedobacter sp. KACC 23697 TaxID=3149230 RepID=A0AAU7K3X3_9SPHI